MSRLRYNSLSLGWMAAAFAVAAFVSTVPLRADDKKKSAPAPAPAHSAPARPAATPRAAVPHAGGAATSNPAGHAGAPNTGGRSATPATGGRNVGGTPNAGGGNPNMGGRNAGGTPNTGGRNMGGSPNMGGRTGSPAATGGRAGGGWNNGNNVSGHSVPRSYTSTPTRSGGSVVRDQRGQVRAVQTRNGAFVSHGPGNSTHIVRSRPDGRMIVASGHGREGYVQRGFAHGGHEYVARSYYVHGRMYEHAYRPYGYHGVSLYAYAPRSYWAPAYYGWVYNPWPAPVYYRWGFVSAPWYGYYGPYFTPYPVYPSAALWLTDYAIATTLELGYQDRLAAGVQAGPIVGQAALTPEVKQAIADEVRNQIALENMAGQASAQGREVDPGSDGIPRMMADGKPHIFLVTAGLTVPASDGQVCPLTHGDVLQLMGPSQDPAAADLKVIATKGRDCAQSSLVSVQFQDLQEMQNSLRANIGQGMEELNKKQGQDGLPVPPKSAQAAPTQTAFAAVIPPPDPNVAQEVQEEAKAATQEEREELGDGGGGPTTIATGQSFEQVRATLGEPKTMVDLGAKKIWVYPSMKITFVDGLVKAVE